MSSIKFQDPKEELPRIEVSSRSLSPEGMVLTEREITIAGKTLEECFEYLW